MFSKFISAAEAVAKIRKTEIALPVARLAGYITPLLVGDDLALRTSVVSPMKYDREMTALLHRRTELIGPDGEPLKWNYEKYISHLSNIDKICSIWGLYKCTYDTLGRRKVKCPADNWGQTLEYEITLDDLVHEKVEGSEEHPDDTFTPWDEEVPFYDYVYPIEVTYSGFVYTFDAWLPTIKHNNRVLSNLSTDIVQKNLESLGSPYTRAEQLALLTKAVRLRPENATSPEDTVETTSVQEILVACRSYIPHPVSEVFFEKYGQRFDRYAPKFYKVLACGACGHKFRYDVDIELEFFRRCIFGRGESGEGV